MATGRMRPWSKARWAMKRKTKAIAGTTATATSGRRRRLTSAGRKPSARTMSRPAQRRRPVQRHAAHDGVDRVGLDLGSGHQPVARRRRDARPAASATPRRRRPRARARARDRPARRPGRRTRRCRSSPAGRGSRSRRRPSRTTTALVGWPVRRATTVASVGRPPCSYSTRCSTPAAALGEVARRRLARRCSCRKASPAEHVAAAAARRSRPWPARRCSPCRRP